MRQQVLDKHLASQCELQTFKQFVARLKATSHPECKKYYREYKMIAGMIERILGKDPNLSTTLLDVSQNVM